jgi:trigger factor
MDDLRTRLSQNKRMQQAAQARDKVLEALIADTEVPLPDSVVKAEVDVRVHDAIHSFDHDEDRLAQWLTEQGQTREEFDAETRADAERSVKTQLVLDAIADAEEVQVSDMDLTQQVVSQAQRFGITPEEFLKRTQEAGQLGAVYADVRRGKALASVVRQATVTDGSGADVDLSEFLRDGSEDAGDEPGDDVTDSAATDDAAAEGAAAEDAAAEGTATEDAAAEGEGGERPESAQEPASAKA